MKKVAFLLALAMVAVSTTGCLIMPAGHSVSTDPIEDMDRVSVIGNAEGAATTVYLFSFIPIGSLNPTRDAIDDALTSVKGDALIDITVDDHWLFLFAFNFQRVKVHATAVSIED